MKFMRSMVYLPIAVMFCLATVILTYNVQQCDQTLQRVRVHLYSPKGSKWFKWARVFSFCRYLNSTYDQGCRTLDCRECLNVCLMDEEVRNVTSLCEINCRTYACKEGCRFYAKVFIKSDVTHNTTIKKPKLNYDNRYMIDDDSVIYGLNLSWPLVFSSDAFEIPSLYLVTMYANTGKYRGESILTLTETSQHLVSVKDMCRGISYISLGFRFYVTPINFDGPKNYKDIEHYYLTRDFLPKIPSVKNVSVSKPFFKKSTCEDEFDHIVWEIDLKGYTDIIEGIRIAYYIDKCPFHTDTIEMKKLNPWKANFVKEGSFRMLIVNTKNDRLDNCLISLELRIWQGECLSIQPYRAKIRYGGCKTVSGYTCPKDTLIYDFSATISSADCVNAFIDACPQSKNITCHYCQTTRHRIKVTWEHPTYVKDIKEYTVRWGELIRGKLIDRKMTRTVRLTKSYTSSYMIDFSATEMKYIGIQIHAETSRSKARWQSNMNSIQKIKLKPVEPKPLSPSLAPMQNEIISRTMIQNVTLKSIKPKLLSPSLAPTKDEISSVTKIVLIVVFFLAVSCCCLLILYIIYRRRSNFRKRVKRNEIEMDEIKERGKADKWEISSSILTVDKKIGEGAFGNVYCAFIKTIELRKTPYAEQWIGTKLVMKKKKVAVKFLKDDALETEYKDFYEEIKLMKDIGFHQNIVNMVGCGTITEPPYLVLEYMNGGDLLHYMRLCRKNRICRDVPLNTDTVDSIGDDSTENVDHLSPRDFMSFSWQIACGMEYLSMNNVVHRDLAARNILISDDKKIKISDFGLSRFVSNELIYLSHNKGRKLPIKWMSIEALYHQEFTTASDVWAYGVVLFEIVTLGGTPYPSIGNRELCKMLKSGYRMDKPDNCDDTVYHIMLHCWNEIPTQRPTFTELREHLEELVEKDEIYLSFDIDENESYYNVGSFKSIPSDANDDGDDAFTNEFMELLKHSRDSLF